jgi:HNH endonuclease
VTILAFFILVGTMPARIPKACRKQGCKHTTINSNGYCDEHQGCGWQRHQNGKTSSQRGYGAQWRKIRAVVLVRDNYLCQECLKQGLFVTATTVDHITPKAHGGSDDLTNLQSLCDSCHKFKTARERLK